MKKFLSSLLEFLQEHDGGNSSRRLIFIYGSIIAIPFSYYYSYTQKELFEIIHSYNLWFLGALGGLTTANNILNNLKK